MSSHNGHVGPFCTREFPTHSHNHAATTICAGPVRILARRCVELRAAAPSGAAPVGGSITRGLPVAERAAPKSADAGACQLLLPSVVIVRCRPRNPVTAHPRWASYRGGAHAMTVSSCGGGR